MHMRRLIRLLTCCTLLGLAIAACGGPARTATPTSRTETAMVEVTPAQYAETPTGVATIAVAPTIAIPPTIEIKSPVHSTSSPELTASTGGVATSEPATAASAGTSATAAATAGARVLEDKWYADADQNGVPDFIESELGYDPAKDDCLAKQCGAGAAGSELLVKERNTLLILDSSGSMAVQLGGARKIDTAKTAIKKYVRVLAPAMNLGFMVYGHKGNNTEAGKAESCAGIDLLAPIGQLKRENIDGILAQFQPTGWTPLAASLAKAAEAFKGKADATNRIVLVSDGLETCGGDPVAVAKQLHDQGLAIEIDVVGFGIKEDTPDAQQLRQIAHVTGGSYYDAKTASDLDNYFRQQGQALAQQWDAMTCELNNSAFMRLCDESFLNKVAAKMREYEAKAAFGSPEAQAYREIEQRIQAKATVRQKQRDEAQGRFDQLQKQYFQLRDQINKALNDEYGKH